MRTAVIGAGMLGLVTVFERAVPNWFLPTL